MARAATGRVDPDADDGLTPLLLAVSDNGSQMIAPGLRVQLETLDRLNPDERATVAAMLEGALLRHQVRQINVS